VVDSRLQSTGHGGQPTINIWASYGDFDGTEGSAYVSGSDLITADRIIIKTGRFGSTAARSNTFSGPGSVVIRTGVGGVCSTFANVPAVPCT
jgi:hypothetical protein